MSLMRSGLLSKFIREGKQYMFISNIDNLGATVDLGLSSNCLVYTITLGIRNLELFDNAEVPT